jgi:hypothetical protein
MQEASSPLRWMGSAALKSSWSGMYYVADDIFFHADLRRKNTLI